MKKMDSITKYQLMQVDTYGREIPIGSASTPLGLFTSRKEAVRYAKEHPDLFRNLRFTVKKVGLLLNKVQELEVAEASKGEPKKHALEEWRA